MHTHSLDRLGRGTRGRTPSGVALSHRPSVRRPLPPPSAVPLAPFGDEEEGEEEGAKGRESGDGGEERRGEGHRRLISGSRQDFGRREDGKEGRNEKRAQVHKTIRI